ncbi:caspase domain-containing protein [Mycena vitilis]|nr:caspase domain-containing protein [Mycena vitilis]
MSLRPIFALVVGINQYQSADMSDLYGCVKDAECIRATLLLLSQDTAPSRIHFLINEDATQARILEAFETHLVGNSEIQWGDPMVVYFAGKGRRIEASRYNLERDVDILLPHDCDGSILGISDFTLRALLCNLARKKGSNITVILDTCFPRRFPRCNIHHRSDTSAVLSPWTYSMANQTAESRGFYTPSSSYVLLAACSEGELAGDTSMGGTFTQALAVEIQRDHYRTYRELCEAIEFASQIPICLGVHADEPMFKITSDFRITKLTVFVDSPSISLEPHDNDDFVRVESKSKANIALSLNFESGSMIIERLDGLVAAYGTPKITCPEQDPNSLPLLLNKIARFSYYLDVKPPSSFWKRIASCMESFQAFPWRRRSDVIEFFQLALNDRGMVLFDQEFLNLLKKDVVHLDQSIAKDRVYGLRITNCFKRKLYPRLFYFDPASYAIMAITLGSGDSQSLQPGSSSIIGMDGQAWRFTPEPSGERDAGFFKLFLFGSVANIDYIQQDSALESGGSSARSEIIAYAPLGNSMFWDTRTATVAILPLTQHHGSWTSWLSRIFSRLF